MPITFSHTLTVPVPPERIWAIVDDVARTPEWLARCIAMEKLTPGPLAAGSRLRYEYRDADSGRDGVMEGEVVARSENEHLAMRFRDSLIHVGVDFRLAAAPGGTTLTHTVELEPKSVLTRLFGWLIKRRLPGQTVRAMEALSSLAQREG